MFFTTSNAKKADAIRLYIEQQRDQLSQAEYYFLLASLLVSLDKVANTACVYGAYLKKFKKSAEKPLVMEPIHQKRDIRVEENEVTQGFAEQIETKSDITYLDPPYNQRSYSANYFVLNFVVQYDSSVVPRGKTGLIDKNQSDFCSKRNVKQAFQKLLDNILSRHIFVSYNNEGLLTQREMLEMLEKKGSVKLYKILYNKFKAQKNVDGDHVYEYLWAVDTQSDSSFQELER
jgi:adenine-specific DNA-methyltransferase